MWNIERFGEASEESYRFAIALRQTISDNELSSSRLPDFVALSRIFGKACLPFREHNLNSHASCIYEALARSGETEIVILENPLYDGYSQRVVAIDLRDKLGFSSLIEEQVFSGGFIVSTLSPLFKWIGNFTDYGFMFTDPPLIEAIFSTSPFTTYCSRTCEFRLSYSNDVMLDEEIRKLDELWAAV